MAPARRTSEDGAAWRGDLGRATQLLATADVLFVFTGSGMSAESGIPTFRGRGGLWAGVRPEAFARDPAFVWSWYQERIADHARAKPHAGHKALAKLQRLYGRQTLVTQNVDLLHEKAGSRGVVHLHGRVSHVRCSSCSRREELTRRMLRHAPPACPACGALLRPDVVWFGESLPEAAFQEASAAAAGCDVALVVGTSNLVYPAASLPLVAKASGARLIEVNPEPTALTDSVDVFIEATAGDALPALARAVGPMRKRRRGDAARASGPRT